MKYLVLSCLFMLSVISYANAKVTSLSATIDKNPVLIDESITLQVSAVGGADSDALDFSVLTNNFRVSKPSVSQSTQIVNFDRTVSTSWTLQLFPRRTGAVTIPSFTIDGQSTDPIQIKVIPVSEANKTKPRDFYVTTEISNQQVYLQQQIQYKVKIYLSGEIQRGSLSEPVLDGAVIEQLGDDSEYEELVNGVRYRVLERNFAILPQASGNFVIDGPVFQAEVLANSRQSFAFFNRTKTINRVAPAKEITVFPIPQDYQYTWLPSEQVQLNDEWQGAQGEFIQGEPITRIITLTALGLIEEQLPQIESEYHPSFKTYPEPAQKATVKQNKRLIAQSVQSTAIIPSEPGTFVLPEIRVPWFDVRSGETKFATLPAQSVIVLAATSSQGQAPSQVASPSAQIDASTQAQGNALDSAIDSAVNNNSNNSALTNAGSSEDSLFPKIAFGLDILHIVLMILVFILMISVLTLVLRNKQHKTGSEQVTQHKPNNENLAWTQLQGAIDDNNIQKIQANLRQWLELVTKNKVQSVNNALLTLGAQKVSESFNAALASEYSLQDAVKDAVQDAANDSYQQNELKAALGSLREQVLNQHDMHSKTNMYPIS